MNDLEQRTIRVNFVPVGELSSARLLEGAEIAPGNEDILKQFSNI